MVVPGSDEPKGLRCELFGPFPVILTLFRAVDAIESDFVLGVVWLDHGELEILAKGQTKMSKGFQKKSSIRTESVKTGCLQE